MAAYCGIADLKIPDIGGGSATLDPQKYVDDAADEMDSKIGWRYATPIDVTDPGPTPRPVRLLLKRLNAFLASGRLILALTALQEDEQLNAYGQHMVDEVDLTLAMIADGEMVLPGLELTDGTTTGELGETPTNPRVTAPMISNLDAESNVEAFYDRVANPDYVYGYSAPPAESGLIL